MYLDFIVSSSSIGRGLKLITFIFVIFIGLHEVFPKKFNQYEGQQVGDSKKSIEMHPPNIGWVDPFEMIKDSPSSDNLFVQSDFENYVLSNRLKKCESYSRRFVNLFLRATKPQEDADDAASDSFMDQFIKLEFFISGTDLKVLHEFGKNEKDFDDRIETVSNIFSKVFTQSSQHEQHYYSFQMIFKGFQRAFYKALNSPEWTVVLSVFLMTVVALWFTHTHSYGLALFALFLIIFVSGFGFTWIRMYEEKEVEKYANQVKHGDVPSHCTGNPMPWYEHMYYRMFGADCVEFFKVRDVRPIVKISPMDVFMETVSSMMVVLSASTGSAYGQFVTNFSDSFPGWMKPFAGLIGSFLPLVIMIIAFIFFFGYSIKFLLTGFYLTPTLFRGNQRVQNTTRKHYIEDISDNGSRNIQEDNTSKIVLPDDKNPVFVAMNYTGFQKFISSSNTVNQSCGDEISVIPAEKQQIDNNQVRMKESEQDKFEINQIERLLVSRKDTEETKNRDRKRKSIHTCTENHYEQNLPPNESNTQELTSDDLEQTTDGSQSVESCKSTSESDNQKI